MRRLETVRRDFVANVSHELRTPVAVIRANAETLLAGAKDDPVIAGKLIDGLHRNAERLARILADLLDLSRLDAGQYRLEVGDRAGASRDRAVADRGRDRRRRSAASRSRSRSPTQLVVRADPKALDQILVNLIDNGVKYTRAEGHVWVEARRDRRRASASRSATTAPASPTSTASACSSGSIAPTRAGRARPAARASACRSSSTSSRAWAARSASSRTRRAAASSGSGLPKADRQPDGIMMTTHTSKDFEQELRTLRERLCAMGGALRAADHARDAGARRARRRARAQGDRRTTQAIDRDENEIDELALQILATRQPVASDLRFITMSLKFVTDLERIGDLAAGIAKRALELNRLPAARRRSADLDALAGARPEEPARRARQLRREGRRSRDRGDHRRSRDRPAQREPVRRADRARRDRSGDRHARAAADVGVPLPRADRRSRRRTSPKRSCTWCARKTCAIVRRRRRCELGLAAQIPLTLTQGVQVNVNVI